MEKAEENIANPFKMFAAMIKMVVALTIGILGCFLFGVIGSMTYPGWGAIAGAGIGFLIFSLIGCCALGVYKDFIPNKQIDTTKLMPGFVTQAMGKHPEFTLMVSVHKAVDVATFKGLNPFASPDTYVVLECGNNPPKATCVKKGSKPEWNEQFVLHVLPADKSVVVKVMDQDVFSSDVVGFVSVDVDLDIIGRGFPQEEEYVLQTGAKGGKAAGKTKVVLSFDYTDDFSKSLANNMKSQFPEQHKKKLQRMKESNQAWQTQDYGSCSHLQTLQFNTQYEQTLQDRKQNEDFTPRSQGP